MTETFPTKSSLVDPPVPLEYPVPLQPVPIPKAACPPATCDSVGCGRPFPSFQASGVLLGLRHDALEELPASTQLHDLVGSSARRLTQAEHKRESFPTAMSTQVWGRGQERKAQSVIPLASAEALQVNQQPILED